MSDCQLQPACGGWLCQRCGIASQQQFQRPGDFCTAQRINLAVYRPVTAREFERVVCPRPSLTARAWHLLGAIGRAVRYLVTERRLPWLVGAPYRERLELCRSNQCGKFAEGRCSACGCNTASGNRILDKARWPAETCPAGLWPPRHARPENAAE